jgi:hypothetical protein
MWHWQVLDIDLLHISAGSCKMGKRRKSHPPPNGEKGTHRKDQPSSKIPAKKKKRKEKFNIS